MDITCQEISDWGLLCHLRLLGNFRAMQRGGTLAWIPVKGALFQYGCRDTTDYLSPFKVASAILRKIITFLSLTLPQPQPCPLIGQNAFGEVYNSLYLFLGAFMASKGPTVTGVYPAVLSQDKLLTVYACYFFK